jgi:hypothetical protein
VPSSTAHILHPDKYFAGETTFCVLSPVPVDTVWTRVPNSYGYLSDTYGEYFISVMLSHWLSDSQAQKVAAVWVGDSFSYYETDYDYLFVWNITWSSIKNASQFTKAFIDLLKLAQATPQDATLWYANGRYIALFWDSNTESTLIMCSSNKSAINFSSIDAIM